MTSSPTKTAAKATPTKAATPQLPEALSKATPNFGYSGKNYKVTINDPLALAAYIIRNSDKKSKSDAKYFEFVMDKTGLNEADARALGQQVYTNVKGNIESGNTKNGVVTFTSKLSLDGEAPVKATPAKTQSPKEVIASRKETPIDVPAPTQARTRVATPSFVENSKPTF